ncbi:hypothetical protein AMTR_s00001p00272540 [Amborella trichopoda]|uniref:Uncharacterized protein n=1 Tax=Amborella trichopoda TaxID=13333 RepID=W1NMF0_AMBTC|nr:hypothetical protein AMTR_s00001p00272540 [Amborella trichopoda]
MVEVLSVEERGREDSTGLNDRDESMSETHHVPAATQIKAALMRSRVAPAVLSDETLGLNSRLSPGIGTRRRRHKKMDSFLRM